MQLGKRVIFNQVPNLSFVNNHSSFPELFTSSNTIKGCNNQLWEFCFTCFFGVPEFKLITKEICKLPSFFSTSLFRKIDINGTGFVTRCVLWFPGHNVYSLMYYGWWSMLLAVGTRLSSGCWSSLKIICFIVWLNWKSNLLTGLLSTCSLPPIIHILRKFLLITKCVGRSCTIMFVTLWRLRISSSSSFFHLGIP